MILKNDRILSDQLAFVGGKWYHTEPFKTLNGDEWYMFERTDRSEIGCRGYYERLDTLMARISISSAFEAFINAKTSIGDKVYSEDKKEARFVKKLLTKEANRIRQTYFDSLVNIDTEAINKINSGDVIWSEGIPWTVK